MTIVNKSDQAKDANAVAPKAAPAPAVAKSSATEASKPPVAKEAKQAKKAMTDNQKLNALIKAAKANGWSLPDDIHDED